MTRTLHQIATDIAADRRPHDGDDRIIFAAEARAIQRRLALVEALIVLNLARSNIAGAAKIAMAIKAAEEAL